MANKAHSGAKKPSKSITPESCQKAKGCFIFSFFFFFRQASSKIMTFMKVSHKTAAFYSSAQPHHFFTTSKPHETLQTDVDELWLHL